MKYLSQIIKIMDMKMEELLAVMVNTWIQAKQLIYIMKKRIKIGIKMY